MVDQDLLTAFNDCIDRLAAGQSVNDCLRRYPQYARALRPMLEAGLTIRRARASTAETSEARARVRQRVAQAAHDMPARPNNIYPLRTFATLAASLLIIFFVATGGAAVASQSSLPGDPLYGIKRLTESVQLALSGGAQRDVFAARRVDETRQLLNLQRPAEVTFTGEVIAVSGAVWVVSGLPVNVTEQTISAGTAFPGDRVEIRGYTTAQGELFAHEIIVIEPGKRDPAPTITPVPTRLPVSATPLPTGQPTNTPSPTVTPSLTATRTPSPTLTQTPTPTITAAGCTVNPPTGWTRYTIQAGDTLSALAAARRVSLDDIIRVNCLTNARLIVAGQQLYLPPGDDPIRFTPAPTQSNVSTPSTGDLPPGGNAPPGDVVNPPGNDNSNDDRNNDNNDDDDNSNSNDNDDDDD